MLKTSVFMLKTSSQLHACVSRQGAVSHRIVLLSGLCTSAKPQIFLLSYYLRLGFNIYSLFRSRRCYSSCPHDEIIPLQGCWDHLLILKWVWRISLNFRRWRSSERLLRAASMIWIVSQSYMCFFFKIQIKINHTACKRASAPQTSIKHIT